MKDTHVILQMADRSKVQASLLWVTRHAASFEIRDPGVSPRTSEKLESFKIVLEDRTLYSGTAVVRGVVNAGITQNCEVSLSERAWSPVTSRSWDERWDSSNGAFTSFLSEWQRVYQVAAEYKVVVADIHSFLTDLNLWLQQVELDLQQLDPKERSEREAELVHQLRGAVIPSIEHLFSRFEAASSRVPADLVPAHRSFCRRQLHPLVLCAPFIHRTFTKPLGYAGDYEMMNMIVRNGLEGRSLFAQLVNAYMLDQAPAHGVRSRVHLLHKKMVGETMRVARQGQRAKVFSVACGPACEVQNFLAESALADQADFYLLDFNQETLNHTQENLHKVKQTHRRRGTIEFIQDSVQSLLRRGSRKASEKAAFDMVYCSGLYDYLSDNVCKALNTYLFDRLQPGGLLVIGNFAPHNPIRNIMEHVLEWFLIYRDSRHMARLAPAQAEPSDCRVLAEESGTNIFLEVRKPE